MGRGTFMRRFHRGIYTGALMAMRIGWVLFHAMDYAKGWLAIRSMRLHRCLLAGQRGRKSK